MGTGACKSSAPPQIAASPREEFARMRNREVLRHLKEITADWDLLPLEEREPMAMYGPPPAAAVECPKCGRMATILHTLIKAVSNRHPSRVIRAWWYDCESRLQQDPKFYFELCGGKTDEYGIEKAIAMLCPEHRPETKKLKCIPVKI